MKYFPRIMHTVCTFIIPFRVTLQKTTWEDMSKWVTWINYILMICVQPRQTWTNRVNISWHTIIRPRTFGRMGSASDRRRYNVTSSLIGSAHTTMPSTLSTCGNTHDTDLVIAHRNSFLKSVISNLSVMAWPRMVLSLSSGTVIRVPYVYEYEASTRRSGEINPKSIMLF